MLFGIDSYGVLFWVPTRVSQGFEIRTDGQLLQPRLTKSGCVRMPIPIPSSLIRFTRSFSLLGGCLSPVKDCWSMMCEVCNRARFFVGLALPPLPLRLVLLSLYCDKELAKLFVRPDRGGLGVVSVSRRGRLGGDSEVPSSDIVGDGSWQRGRLGTGARLAGGEYPGTAESQVRISVSCISVKWYNESTIDPGLGEVPKCNRHVGSRLCSVWLFNFRQGRRWGNHCGVELAASHSRTVSLCHVIVLNSRP